jgi:hypothetical protein
MQTHELKIGAFFPVESKLSDAKILDHIGTFPKTLECGLGWGHLWIPNYQQESAIKATGSRDGAMKIQPSIM